jgi:hypothetical protein
LIVGEEDAVDTRSGTVESIVFRKPRAAIDLPVERGNKLVFRLDEVFHYAKRARDDHCRA